MSLIDDIQNNFIRRYGAVAQIIVICVGVYLILGIPKVILLFMGVKDSPLDIVYDFLVLFPNFNELIFKPWTIITYGFIHLNVFHILFNMLWMFWMGQLLREYQGDKVIWSTFIIGTISGGLAFILCNNFFPVGLNLRGASAGINAIVVAAATLLPNHTIFLFLFGAVRLKWLVLFFVALDFISITEGNPGGHISHLGGALFGFLFIYYKKQGVDLAQPYHWFTGLFESKPKPKSSPIKITHRKGVSTPSQVEIDRILDKIKAVGYDKLTTEEKQTLFNASQD